MAITDQSEEVPAPSPLQKFFKDLGPGVITGAADDDPSGISTYSVAGATFGYTGLWTALFTFPLMAAVQLMCARLGMVTGQGLAAVIRKRYSRWILWPSCAVLADREYIQYRSRLGRHGRCDANGYWSAGLFLDAPVRLRHCRSPVLDLLPRDGPRPQMVDVGVVRIRHHRVSCATRLVDGASRHVHSAH